MVDYVNDHLRLINRNCGTPRISQDIIASSKGDRAERTSYRKNWNVYSVLLLLLVILNLLNLVIE
jgi:hypothetical protein